MSFNMYRLTDSREYKDHKGDGRTYDRAANIWGFEVVGGALATAIGTYATVVGVQMAEKVGDIPEVTLAATTAFAIGGVALVGHGFGRLSEIARHDLVERPPMPKPTDI